MSVKFKRVALPQVGNQLIISEIFDNQDPIYLYALDPGIVGESSRRLLQFMALSTHQNKFTLAEFLELIYRD
jgi:hypothetical protein